MDRLNNTVLNLLSTAFAEIENKEDDDSVESIHITKRTLLEIIDSKHLKKSTPRIFLNNTNRTEYSLWNADIFLVDNEENQFIESINGCIEKIKIEVTTYA